MEEGWEGVNPLPGASDDTKFNAPDYIMARSEHLGGITPTLTRPHQGGGNALAICQHLRRAERDRGPRKRESEGHLSPSGAGQ